MIEPLPYDLAHERNPHEIVRLKINEIIEVVNNLEKHFENAIEIIKRNKLQ